MNANFKSAKTAVRNFLRDAYDDEHLAMLLAHAESGRLAYTSCCCIIGIPTAPHPLEGSINDYQHQHYLAARAKFGTGGGRFSDFGHDDEERRRVLIPMVKAEMRRRDRLRNEPTDGGQGPGVAVLEATAV